jgi:hypothetical protein
VENFKKLTSQSNRQISVFSVEINVAINRLIFSLWKLMLDCNVPSLNVLQTKLFWSSISGFWSFDPKAALAKSSPAVDQFISASFLFSQEMQESKSKIDSNLEFFCDIWFYEMFENLNCTILAIARRQLL